MARCIIVSAADAKYFPLLRDCLTSIRSFPELADVPFRVIDLGLTADQIDWLKGQRADTFAVDWEFDFPNRAAAPRSWLAMAARPYLPRHLPDAEVIMWLDADIWVQRADLLKVYLDGAQRHGFVATPEIDRAYPGLYDDYNRVRNFHHSVYSRCFGRQVADQMIQYPIINGGAFAARREHPFWNGYREVYERTMQDAQLMHAEQASMNFVIYGGGDRSLRPHMLPSLANWICGQALPAWDPARRMLVDPNLPHEPIGLLHLTGYQKEKVALGTIDGGTVSTQLTYSAIRELQVTGLLRPAAAAPFTPSAT